MSALTERVLVLRPNLLADLSEPSAASLAALIGWADVDGLRRALDGEACGVDLVSAFVSHFLVVPFAYFATTV